MSATERILVPRSDLLVEGVPARTWTTDPAEDYYIPTFTSEAIEISYTDAFPMYWRALMAVWEGLRR